MLKTRIIPTLLYKDFGLVKGIGFDSWRRVGGALQAINVYSIREVDELMFLDITATADNRTPDLEIIDDLADECFMPLTVGGGIRTVEDVHKLLMVGADKVAVNTAAVADSNLVSEVANRFGSQCVIVSIDYRKGAGGSFEVFTHAGKNPTGIDPIILAKQAAENGAGEILLTSIDRDGTMQGYDLDCLKKVCDAVSIPVIASGGAGKAEDVLKAVTEGRAAAVAAASIFHFTEQTPLEIKQYLHDRNIPVRM